MTIIETDKSVSDTIADLRVLFSRYGIEDWEPIPSGDSQAYTVRYHQSGAWMEVASYLQPTKAHNIRQCLQVIQYLFLWGARGVSGVASGTAFIQGGLATRSDTKRTASDEFAEACATIGVEADVSLDEAKSVWRAKIGYAHPDKAKEPDENKRRTERTRRLNLAMAVIEQVKKG